MPLLRSTTVTVAPCLKTRALGTDGREYPWGDGYGVGYTNLNEQSLGVGPYYLNRTTAVGKSPFDVLDMAGTILEWCLNDYKNPETIDGYGNGEWKVLRGGSFIFNHYDAAVSFRYDFYPSNAYVYFGFRVVLSAPIASLKSDNR
jgi:formylglycine-generating enzyme required for sulfatase activity